MAAKKSVLEQARAATSSARAAMGLLQEATEDLTPRLEREGFSRAVAERTRRQALTNTER